MISESQYWKEAIAGWADHLERRVGGRRWTERGVARVEKAVMLGCFAIRKIIEAKGRLSDATLEMQTPVLEFARRKSHFTHLNWNQLDRHFDLDRHRHSNLKLEELCNQVIHSYVFTHVTDGDGGLSAIMFVSDYRRQRVLYFIDIADVVAAFRAVACDNPDVVSATYDPTILDFRFSAESSRTGNGA